MKNAAFSIFILIVAAGFSLAYIETASAILLHFSLPKPDSRISHSDCGDRLVSDTPPGTPTKPEPNLEESLAEILMEYWYGTDTYSYPFLDAEKGTVTEAEATVDLERRNQIEEHYKEITGRLLSPFGLRQKFRQALVEMGHYADIEEVPRDLNEIPLANPAAFFAELAANIDAPDLFRAVEALLASEAKQSALTQAPVSTKSAEQKETTSLIDLGLFELDTVDKAVLTFLVYQLAEKSTRKDIRQQGTLLKKLIQHLHEAWVFHRATIDMSEGPPSDAEDSEPNYPSDPIFKSPMARAKYRFLLTHYQVAGFGKLREAVAAYIGEAKEIPAEELWAAGGAQ